MGIGEISNSFPKKKHMTYSAQGNQIVSLVFIFKVNDPSMLEGSNLMQMLEILSDGPRELDSFLQELVRSEQGTEVWLDEIRQGLHVNTCDV